MIREWKCAEWTRYTESWHCQENFEWRHGYVRENKWKVIMDLRLWTSDGMDDLLRCSWRFLQCLEENRTIIWFSKLLQLRRCERTWTICVFVFVRVRWSEWECPFVGRVCVCHAVLLVRLSAPNTWGSSWTIAPRGPSLWQSSSDSWTYMYSS